MLRTCERDVKGTVRIRDSPKAAPIERATVVMPTNARVILLCTLSFTNSTSVANVMMTENAIAMSGISPPARHSNIHRLSLSAIWFWLGPVH